MYCLEFNKESAMIHKIRVELFEKCSEAISVSSGTIVFLSIFSYFLIGA